MLKMEDQTLKMVPSDGHVDPFPASSGLLVWSSLENVLSGDGFYRDVVVPRLTGSKALALSCSFLRDSCTGH